MSSLELFAQEFAENVAPGEDFGDDIAYKQAVRDSIKGDFIEGFLHASEMFLGWEANGLNLRKEFENYTNSEYELEEIQEND